MACLQNSELSKMVACTRHAWSLALLVANSPILKHQTRPLGFSRPEKTAKLGINDQGLPTKKLCKKSGVKKHNKTGLKLTIYFFHAFYVMLFTCQAKKTFGNSPNGSPKIDKRDPFPKLVLEDEFCPWID